MRVSGASYGLTDGGKGGMIYTYLGVLCGFSFPILSMAEMASMYVHHGAGRPDPAMIPP